VPRYQAYPRLFALASASSLLERFVAFADKLSDLRTRIGE
jgi:hypothetical protein